MGPKHSSLKPDNKQLAESIGYAVVECSSRVRQFFHPKEASWNSGCAKASQKAVKKRERRGPRRGWLVVAAAWVCGSARTPFVFDRMRGRWKKLNWVTSGTWFSLTNH